VFFLDKIADAKARAAVKAQIEADKKTRAERTAKEKALREVSFKLLNIFY